jgi:signal transduction histidine kinase/ActR/RegA family two-component response regulator
LLRQLAHLLGGQALQHLPSRGDPAESGTPKATRVLAYSGAALVVGIATLVRVLLQPYFEQNLPFATFFTGVFVTAWLYGFGPTLFATLLSALIAERLFLAPVVTFAQEGAVTAIGLTLFVATGLAAGAMGESRLRAQRRAEVHAAEAEQARALAEDTAAQAEEEAARAEEEKERAKEEAVRADNEAARANAALEALRASQAQLLHSQQLDAIGQLAGGVAHDFNNVLTVISGYTALLLERLPPDDSRREDALGIQEATERAAALTQQLLAFGRKQVMQPEVIDTGEVIADTGRMLRRLIGEHIDLAIVTGPMLSPVLADRGQLSQILVNLAVNARDAMPEGGRLTIEARDVPLTEEYADSHLAVEHGPYVRIAVSDTGHGMPPEVQEHIFEPFFTTKPRGRGSGLGLSTVFGIVKQFGGHIFVYSEPGQGTTLKIYLPRAEGAVTPVATPRQAPATNGTETILVVEDEAAIRAIVCRVLEAQGYQVLQSASPREALGEARQHSGPIHLLLTDVVLPEMNGRELADRLDADRPGLPVLYMSGYTDSAILHHGRLEPSTEFLPKPFMPETLLRRVREVLDRGSRAAAAR